MLYLKLEASAHLLGILGLGLKLTILATCSACSIKILLDSCRVFLENTKIEQAKERLCWQGGAQDGLCPLTLIARFRFLGYKRRQDRKTIIIIINK